MWSLFWGFFGLIIGSFLSVVIFRVPRHESIVQPRSHCPRCHHVLKAWELVPVVSFLFLRGRCHTCGVSIPWRDPAIELLTGFLFFLWVWINPGESVPVLMVHIAIIALLLILAFIDWDTYRLPDCCTLPLLFLGIISSFLFPMGVSGGESIASAIGAGGVFWLIAKLYPQGMGLGDVKLIAGMGAFLGFPHILLALFLASLTGSIVGLMGVCLRRQELRTPIPFGPFLVFGAYVTLYAGDWMIQTYLTLF